ncbi:hypothetical protein [Clostridium sp. D53t1_180928_C8]|uniref:hypothetical protein n=1 Tax=Clostridium sp. D53t1_180928_C8 TaxID=2787101 RepID=UPI0018AB3FF1|nr:hypothetical protein [Clostridium sp. D53t1_180928_C8]
MKLFEIKDLVFNKEDFLDDISEFEDLLPIIEELQNELIYEEIECVGENDCCGKSNKNYIIEIQGFLNEEDEFVTKKELEEKPGLSNYKSLDLFVIRLYKCVSCGKWIIDILE